MDETPPEVIRLAVVSEVALGEGGAARPIHALRTGTFVGMSGTPTTFEPKHLRQMAERLNAMTARRRPPINENHDMGRAVGRMLTAYTRNRDNDLFIEPKWLSAGRTLLADEVYDGFSIEVQQGGDGYTIVGGALTNYPAVDGLATVTLSAPPPEALETVLIDPAPEVPATTTEEIPMAEDTPIPVAETPPPVAADLSAMLAQAFQGQQFGEAMTARFTELFTAQMQQQIEMARTQAEAAAARQIAEFQARQQIESYAQHITTPTMQRQHALPGQAEEYSAFLAGLTAPQRARAQELFNRILSAGLVSFEEIGSAGEGTAPDPAEQFQAAVAAKVGTGLSRSAAIDAVRQEKPDLYRAYNASGVTKKGGR